MKKINATFNKSLSYLLLLPLFFVLKGYNERFGYLTVEVVILAFIISTASATILYLLNLLFFRDARKAAFLAFSMMIFTLTFGSLHDFLKEIATNAFISKYIFILPFTSICLFAFIYYLKRTANTFKKANVFLNILMLLLTTIELVSLTYKFLKPPVLIDDRLQAFKQFKQISNKTSLSKPDIYFLVFDAMPSSKAMLEHWEFDNSALDSFLVREGFYVAADSKSNYNITMLSVSSCLNMDYLLPEQIFRGGEIEMIEKASPSFLKNSTTEILKREGYQIHQYQPLSTENKDWKKPLYFQSIITDHYWLKTFPGRIYSDLGWHLDKNSLIRKMRYAALKKKHISSHKNIVYTIEQIKKSCFAKDTPKFVYGHFMLPHGPYIYDSAGCLRINRANFSITETEKVLFMGQVKYVNKLINELVLFIKNNNNKNTIIIIEGDHGFRNIFGEHYMTFDNLNAIYFPDCDYQELTPSQTPVNTFRYVFRKFFGADFPILKDSSSFIPYTLNTENQN